jgi:steroid delta-isomerase-like uncharacterized protein
MIDTVCLMTTSELLERYNAAWNAHDLDAITALHTGDMVFENHTAGERAEGDDVRAHIAAIFDAWPDLAFATRRAYDGPGHAVCEWTASATHTQPMRRGDLVAQPSGARLSWEGVDVFTLRDGLIARKDVYSDSVTILRAVGLLT